MIEGYKMDDIEIVQRIKKDIEEDRPEEEILKWVLQKFGDGQKLSKNTVESITTIQHPKIAKILNALLGLPVEKEIKKTIKRSLYRLKSKGVITEDISSKNETPVFRPLPRESPKGFAGNIDTLGRRILMLVEPMGNRGVNLMYGVSSDTEGLISFVGLEFTRKQFRTFFEDIKLKDKLILIEIEPSYVGHLFFKAYGLNLEKGKEIPQDYLLFKSVIEKVRKDYEKTLIYSYLREEEIEGDGYLLRRGGELLELDLFNGWLIDEKEIRPYGDMIWEAESSRIVLTKIQKEARFQDIYRKALYEIFTDERRLLYQQRLEEMAYILLRLGRDEQARISFAQALDLRRPVNIFQPNPFLLKLVIKSIRYAMEDAYKEKESSLILRP